MAAVQIAQVKKFILGTIIGDALGLPVNKKPHHVIRMYFKGIKGYTDIISSTQKPTGLSIGQNSCDIAHSLDTVQRMISNNDSAKNILSYWLETFVKTEQLDNRELVTSFLLSHANVNNLNHLINDHDMKNILDSLLGKYLPIDISSVFQGAMTENHAILFAMTMIMRGKELDLETTTLSTINMGGMTTLTGALVCGSLAFLGKSIPQNFLIPIDSKAKLLLFES